MLNSLLWGDEWGDHHRDQCCLVNPSQPQDQHRNSHMATLPVMTAAEPGHLFKTPSHWFVLYFCFAEKVCTTIQFKTLCQKSAREKFPICGNLTQSSVVKHLTVSFYFQMKLVCWASVLLYLLKDSPSEGTDMAILIFWWRVTAACLHVRHSPLSSSSSSFPPFTWLDGVFLSRVEGTETAPLQWACIHAT